MKKSVALIISLAILFMSLSASAQELIMYGSVKAIKKRSVIVTSDGREMRIRKSLIPGVKVGETVKILLGSKGVVRIERIEKEQPERPVEILK